MALITESGILMRTRTDAISRMSRATRGVIVMRPDAGDAVASMAYINDRSDPDAEADDADVAVDDGAEPTTIVDPLADAPASEDADQPDDADRSEDADLAEDGDPPEDD